MVSKDYPRAKFKVYINFCPSPNTITPELVRTRQPELVRGAEVVQLHPVVEHTEPDHKEPVVEAWSVEPGASEVGPEAFEVDPGSGVAETCRTVA